MVPVPNEEEGQTLNMMAAIYFIIFIGSEAFIRANHLVTTVTSSLWESPFTHAKEEQRDRSPVWRRARTGHPGQTGSVGLQNGARMGRKAPVKPTVKEPRFGGPL